MGICSGSHSKSFSVFRVSHGLALLPRTPGVGSRHDPPLLLTVKKIKPRGRDPFTRPADSFYRAPVICSGREGRCRWGLGLCRLGASAGNVGPSCPPPRRWTSCTRATASSVACATAPPTCSAPSPGARRAARPARACRSWAAACTSAPRWAPPCPLLRLRGRAGDG